MFNLSKFGFRLKELMEEKNLNAPALGCEIHTDRTNITRYIRDERFPQFMKFVDILNYFNCSADFLLGASEYSNDNKTYLPIIPFDRRLREVLKEYGKSQYGLEKEKHISGALVHDWLTGKRLPSIENLVKLQITLSVPLIIF